MIYATDTMTRKFQNRLVIEVVDPRLGLVVAQSKTYNSRVQAGGVAVHAAIFGGTGITFKYICLTNNAAFAPANTDTTVSGEIVGSGLSRQAGTVTLASTQSVLNGTAQTTITTSWTAGATITIYGAGCLSAASGGTLGFEATTTATPVSSGFLVNLSWAFNE
jgi:hypothetical protein